MDCNMPVMDGFQATREIRQILKAINIDDGLCKIVAVTAYTTDNFKIKCFDSGMDLFLTKPTNKASIHQILLDFHIIQ